MEMTDVSGLKRVLLSNFCKIMERMTHSELDSHVRLQTNDCGKLWCGFREGRNTLEGEQSQWLQRFLTEKKPYNMIWKEVVNNEAEVCRREEAIEKA